MLLSLVDVRRVGVHGEHQQGSTKHGHGGKRIEERRGGRRMAKPRRGEAVHGGTRGKSNRDRSRGAHVCARVRPVTVRPVLC